MPAGPTFKPRPLSTSLDWKPNGTLWPGTSHAQKYMDTHFYSTLLALKNDQRQSSPIPKLAREQPPVLSNALRDITAWRREANAISSQPEGERAGAMENSTLFRFDDELWARVDGLQRSTAIVGPIYEQALASLNPNHVGDTIQSELQQISSVLAKTREAIVQSTGRPHVSDSVPQSGIASTSDTAVAPGRAPRADSAHALSRRLLNVLSTLPLSPSSPTQTSDQDGVCSDSKIPTIRVSFH